MWEDMTYESILADMLSRVTSDVDKREGSVIYDALAPCALQLAQSYFYMDAYLDLVFGDTAIGAHLDRIVADSGLARKPATYAERKVITTGPVDIGTRWGLDDTSYEITELISGNTYRARCEQIGAIGNQYSGTLENIDNVSGVTATLTDIIASGEDIETDENLRARYYSRIRSAGTSGNIYNYRNWALEVPGCGDAKVFPLWDGPGTVKVLVIDEDMAIDPALPDAVAAHIESVRPIGATVTVESPTGLTIDVEADVLLDGSRLLADVQNSFSATLSAYLNEIAFETYSVSYAKVGSLLLSTDGVQDYSGLLINSGTANITIAPDEMAVSGLVTLTEVS